MNRLLSYYTKKSALSDSFVQVVQLSGARASVFIVHIRKFFKI